ncbi:2'-5' RNA ligase family protein [Aurantimonas sp. VKM B-3413]|uniref:2'-5' RNA ligase family protein n=1 Tax=Aurantimonas sp. VKM B-3413 TaxID=2779401 RepID=UPI001E65BFF7|nr:2'-5' RNA ligase family protein [Aurantimonas sp. VKM B-3413]MCB8838158.1 2'-5' RNA ligase family protein [Aurantimonas sp. VKM B-3413]
MRAGGPGSETDLPSLFQIDHRDEISNYLFMRGITIRSSEAAPAFWRTVERASELEIEPSVATLGYPPHLTLVRYDDVDQKRLEEALHAFHGVRAFSLKFHHMRIFKGDVSVLWLAPCPDSRLLEVHAKVQAMVGDDRCDPHYCEGTWLPHCTLAASIPRSRQTEAEALANEPIEPIEITFDEAEALEWPPIRSIRRQRLD